MSRTNKKEGAGSDPGDHQGVPLREKEGFFQRIFFYSINQFFFQYTGSGKRGFYRALAGFAVLVGILVLLIGVTPADLPMVYQNVGYEQPSIIYGLDQERKPVPIAELYRFNRKVIDLNDDPGHGLDSKVARAFLAAEDNNFLYHPGVDPQGILRAALVNLLSGRIKEGASTITQQVSRLRYLTRERSFIRKAREAFLSLMLELRLPKREILEIYLNEVPLGHGTIGVEAASRFYFQKSAFDLSWGEAAVLSSLTTRPYDFSPLRNVKESRAKVQVTFQKLIESGHLTTDEAKTEFERLQKNYYEKLNRSPNDSAFNTRMDRFPYVTGYVLSILPDRYKKRVYTGGLKIYTSIQIQHQEAASTIFTDWLKKQTERRKRPPFKHFDEFDETYGESFPLLRDLFGIPPFRTRMTRDLRAFNREFISELREETALLSFLSGTQNMTAAMEEYLEHGEVVIEEQLPVEGGLISLRPDSGEITAIVGGSGFESSNQLLRFLTSRRQPGSSFKPIVYASGLQYTLENPNTEKPLTAATLIDDSPLQFVSQDLSEYSPENYSGGYDGLIRLREALVRSKNAVAVRTYERMGSASINPIAERILQMNKTLPREATVALGSFEMTPMEMARAYAVFASGGKEVFPHALLRIENSQGRILEDYEEKYAKKTRKQLISPTVAQIITSMMEDVIKNGTGRAASLWGRPAAGKTGTTNRNTNAWFVGFTPRLVTSIQIGHDYVRSMGPGSTGGSLAAPVWGSYMREALKGEPVMSFQFPESQSIRINICSSTGMLPGPGCEKIITELFVPGTQPREVSDEVIQSPPYREFDPSSEDPGSVFDAGDF